MRHKLLQDKKNQQKQAEKQQAKKLAELAMSAKNQMDRHVDDTLELKLDKLLSKKVKPNAMKKRFIGKQVNKKKQSRILQLFRLSNPSGRKPYWRHLETMLLEITIESEQRILRSSSFLKQRQRRSNYVLSSSMQKSIKYLILPSHAEKYKRKIDCTDKVVKTSNSD